MKGKALVILAASVLAFPVLAAGPHQQPARQPAGPSWNWDPDVVGEKYIYRHRTQTANQYQEQNKAKDTNQNRFRESNASRQQQGYEANNLGW